MVFRHVIYQYKAVLNFWELLEPELQRVAYWRIQKDEYWFWRRTTTLPWDTRPWRLILCGLETLYNCDLIASCTFPYDRDVRMRLLMSSGDWEKCRPDALSLYRWEFGSQDELQYRRRILAELRFIWAFAVYKETSDWYYEPPTKNSEHMFIIRL